MRRYDDPVETRMGLISGVEGPEQFLWRGRLWKVRAVVAHWVETGPWWQSGRARAVIGSDEPASALRSADLCASDRLSADLLAEREMWRVEAGRGPASTVQAGVRAAHLDPDDPDDPGAPDAPDAPDAPGDPGGVFDLAFDWNDGRWALVGCAD